MIEFQHVSKVYAGEVYALRDVSFTIGDGELVFLAGPSGAGKSTLLKMIAGMEKPSSGAVMMNGQDISKLKSGSLPYLRRKTWTDPARSRTSARSRCAKQCDVTDDRCR